MDWQLAIEATKTLGFPVVISLALLWIHSKILMEHTKALAEIVAEIKHMADCVRSLDDKVDEYLLKRLGIS